MTVKKQISARIDTDLMNNYIDEFQKFQQLKFENDYPVKDITLTQILENALFFATKYLEEKNSIEK